MRDCVVMTTCRAGVGLRHRGRSCPAPPRCGPGGCGSTTASSRTCRRCSTSKPTGLRPARLVLHVGGPGGLAAHSL